MRAVNWFLSWDKWELFVGLWFQHSGLHPRDVAGRYEGLGVLGAPGWERDLQKADKFQRGEHVDRWFLPADAASQHEIREIAAHVEQNDFWRVAFVDAIRHWARKEALHLENSRVQAVLEKAGWCRPVMTLDWVAMAEIKSMDDGAEKERKVAQAYKESPLWTKRCMDEHLCGS